MSRLLFLTECRTNAYLGTVSKARRFLYRLNQTQLVKDKITTSLCYSLGFGSMSLTIRIT
ncbi:hypothetical protein Plhal304r1_c030g0097121 [Plasmopara halstedii]